MALQDPQQIQALVETQGKIMIAQQFPRDMELCRQEALRACESRDFAEKAEWCWPVKVRKKNDVTGQWEEVEEIVSGKSIRLAEAAATSLGHMDFGHDIVRTGEDRGFRSGGSVGFSDVTAYAWDMQKNNRVCSKFRVYHWHDKKGGGGYPITSERDILMLINSKASRHVRNCLFAIMPTWIVEEMEVKCREVRNATPISDRISHMVTAFRDNLDVDLGRLEDLRGTRRDAWTTADVRSLGNLFNSIKDGYVSIDEAFTKRAVEEPSAPGSDMEARIKAEESRPNTSGTGEDGKAKNARLLAGEKEELSILYAKLSAELSGGSYESAKSAAGRLGVTGLRAAVKNLRHSVDAKKAEPDYDPETGEDIPFDLG
jgi:hypothetical protein